MSIAIFGLVFLCRTGITAIRSIQPDKPYKPRDTVFDETSN